jgi:polyphenol oxidase
MIQSEILKARGIRHGFFTREGGVSGGIYASLNCGLGSKDDPEHVRENRSRVTTALGAEPSRLVSIHQVHSPRVVVAEAPWEIRPEADAIATATPGLAISVLTADCTPILLADPEARVVGAAHAGWRGAKGGVIPAVVAAMIGLGATRANIRATVGPAISQAAYEVGDDFQVAFISDCDSHGQYFRAGANGRPHFDLPGFCVDRLKQEDVGQISNLGLCTYGNESLFFSFRRSTHKLDADYGRQISAILIL